MTFAETKGYDTDTNTRVYHFIICFLYLLFINIILPSHFVTKIIFILLIGSTIEIHFKVKVCTPDKNH